MTRLSDLPDGVLLHIFSFFDSPKTVCRLSRVCKRWNELTEDPSLWRNVNLLRFSPDLHGLWYLLRHRFCEGTRSLQICGRPTDRYKQSKISKKQYISSSLLTDLGTRCSSLSCLALHSVTLTSVAVTSLPPGIERLVLKDSEVPHRWFKDVNLPNLRLLDLSNCVRIDVDDIVDLCEIPRLNILSVSGCYRLSVIFMLSFAGVCNMWTERSKDVHPKDEPYVPTGTKPKIVRLDLSELTSWAPVGHPCELAWITECNRMAIEIVSMAENQRITDLVDYHKLFQVLLLPSDQQDFLRYGVDFLAKFITKAHKFLIEPLRVLDITGLSGVMDTDIFIPFLEILDLNRSNLALLHVHPAVVMSCDLQMRKDKFSGDIRSYLPTSATCARRFPRDRYFGLFAPLFIKHASSSSSSRS